MGGKGGGRIGRCGLHAHKQGGEADKGGCRGAGIGAPGARHVGEHVVVRALEGDAPLFVVAEFACTTISVTLGAFLDRLVRPTRERTWRSTRVGAVGWPGV